MRPITLEKQAFRRLTFWSVLGGLCPLIPVPFMDDWALERVQRRMIQEIDREEKMGLTAEDMKILAGGEDPRWAGCVGTVAWALREVTGAILGKLFRTVFYFLTIRRSVRRSAETLHLGYLVLCAARLGETRARVVRAAILATLQEMNTRAIHRTLTRDFRQSLSLLLPGAALLGRLIPRRRSKAAKAEEIPGGEEAFRRQDELLGGLVDRVAADLWGNRAYFAELERVFEGKLASGIELPP
ncbi:MAG TPA: hypothetical protein VLQ45_18970 [Thermoanaerobaculia bacterium]|nr:hypothetical protein [Thermoanaerobaculia bacterium]